MSIWSSVFTLHRDDPFGAPYDLDWPPGTEDDRWPNGFLDIAVVNSDNEGWVRVIVSEDFDKHAGMTVGLSPAQTSALIAVLQHIVDGTPTTENQ